ncbi:MAG: enoyl-CoA hydratase/isomerase family protein [Acidimicrobiales bacterium]
MLVLPADAGPVRTLTLNRPDALNALTPALLEELGDALALAADDGSVRVVVVTGTGRAFSAGVDLKALAEAPVDGGDVSDSLNAPARRVTDLLSTMPKTTIAKVNGFCFTGALELALACDLMVCADDAKMGDTHAKFGLRPTWGMSARLAAAVGITRARELSFTGRTFLGHEAAVIGLAAASVPAGELDATVAEMAGLIAANSADSIAAYKDLYRHQQDLGLADGLGFEYAAHYPMSGAGDRIAGFGRS